MALCSGGISIYSRDIWIKSNEIPAIPNPKTMDNAQPAFLTSVAIRRLGRSRFPISEWRWWKAGQREKNGGSGGVQEGIAKLRAEGEGRPACGSPSLSSKREVYLKAVKKRKFPLQMIRHLGGKNRENVCRGDFISHVGIWGSVSNLPVNASLQFPLLTVRGYPYEAFGSEWRPGGGGRWNHSRFVLECEIWCNWPDRVSLKTQRSLLIGPDIDLLFLNIIGIVDQLMYRDI
jgi:hypothetical protein